MDIATMFLAQIWGPVILAVGAGIFVSRAQYANLYRHLERESLAVLIFGMAGIALGVVHIGMHNVWNTFPQILVSLLGWGLLLKGTLFTVAPKLVDRGGDWAADSKLIPLVGVSTLLLGAYLSYVGYLA